MSIAVVRCSEDAKPFVPVRAVDVAQTLRALDHRTRADEDEVGCEVLGQPGNPLSFVQEEDVHHQLVDAFRKGGELTASGHILQFRRIGGDHSGPSVRAALIGLAPR